MSLCWQEPFYVHSFVQDTNDHDILIVHDHVEYDVVSGSDSQKAICDLIIGPIGYDGWVYGFRTIQRMCIPILMSGPLLLCWNNGP